MNLDSIKNTKAKRNEYHVVNVHQKTFDKMKDACVKLNCAHRTFVDLAINTLINQYEKEKENK
tara:strand:+ start:49 stop:237 length:189 start_codon:yes stop_codon:yes gene_type:complete